MYDSYPRPQLKRKEWQSLNGTWTINGVPGKVPSCRTEEQLVYETSFEFKREKARVLLHFGAVDQIARVYVNSIFVGEHIGGYIHFTLDISDAVKDGSNLLRVDVTDMLDHRYPYGKQRKDRGGMWYTPMSGIWQSVWIEQLPSEYISSVKILPDLKGADLEIGISSAEGFFIKKQRIEVDNPQLWTPENPRLYYRTIRHGEDEAEIYFALRTIDIREINGINRVCLNGNPIFLHGVLDQGYFKNGLVLPESPLEYERDVLRMKELGFNLIRKHIKVEPEDFYYACDKQGMLVMQDMVNSGEYNFLRDTVLGTIGIHINDRKDSLDDRMKFFIEHCRQTQDEVFNHPSVIAYTIFNEGWGQFNSDELYDSLKSYDNSRLYDSTSGWFAQKKSDFDSEHIYFRLKKLHPKKRPLFVTECGGYSLNQDNQTKSYGYGKCKDKDELTDRFIRLYEKMIIPAIQKGCCGCIYTQLSDIEDEINGLYSYDRTVCKVDHVKIKGLADRLKI